MIEIGPATADEMVLEFLKAEVDSPRFGMPYPSLFQQLGSFGITKEALFENADLNSSRDNLLRTKILGAVRGYGGNCLLFGGFPNDVIWRRVGIESTDWTVFKYANDPAWVALSVGSRRLSDGAHNVDSISVGNANEHIRSLVREISNGTRHPALIGVEDGRGNIILAEGHCRATAYAIVMPKDPIEGLVGRSPGIQSWRYY